MRVCRRPMPSMARCHVVASRTAVAEDRPGQKRDGAKQCTPTRPERADGDRGRDQVRRVRDPRAHLSARGLGRIPWARNERAGRRPGARAAGRTKPLPCWPRPPDGIADAVMTWCLLSGRERSAGLGPLLGPAEPLPRGTVDHRPGPVQLVLPAQLVQQQLVSRHVVRGRVPQVHKGGQEPADEHQPALRDGTDRPFPQPGRKPGVVLFMPQRAGSGAEFGDRVAGMPIMPRSSTVTARAHWRQSGTPETGGIWDSIFARVSRITETMRDSCSGVRRATGTEQLMASVAGVV